MSIGNLFKCLFGKNSAPDRKIETELPLCVNARVVNVFGKKGTVTHIDPGAEHGMGVVRVQYEDGSNASFALIASGLTVIPEE